MWKWAIAHKVSSVVIAAVVIWGGYYGYGKLTTPAAQTRYVLAQATKGTLVTSVSGTGQVSVSSQVDVKAQASGTITYVNGSQGQPIKAGDIIAKIDTTDAEKAVRDAQANLLSAQIALQKLTEPTTALNQAQAQDALAQAEQSKIDATNSLAKAYSDGFTSVSNAFLDLPGIFTGMDGVMNGSNLSSNQGNTSVYLDLVKLYRPDAPDFFNKAVDSYQTAKALYTQNLIDYKNTSITSGATTTAALINETYATVQSTSDAIKDLKSFLDMVNDTLTSNKQARIPSLLATQETQLQGYTSTNNSHMSDLLNIENTITSSNNTIAQSNQTINEKTLTLQQLTTGPDPLDVQAAKLTVEQRQNALTDAQDTLANYYVTAPFDGVLAKVDVKLGDNASSGAVIGTVITNQQIAQITLNETDIAQVKLGQKATLTFDALPDLSLTGKVTEIDTLGTISQGVVTYGVQIALDATDPTVRSGMSVSASIITNVYQDAILVPTSAIKSQGQNSYVSVFATPPAGATSATASTQGVVSPVAPTSQTIQIGAADDTMTQVLSGLNEGDTVVTRTVTITAAPAAAASSGSLLGGVRIPGVTGGGGGFGGAARTGGAAGATGAARGN